MRFLKAFYHATRAILLAFIGLEVFVILMDQFERAKHPEMKRLSMVDYQYIFISMMVCFLLLAIVYFSYKYMVKRMQE